MSGSEATTASGLARVSLIGGWSSSSPKDTLPKAVLDIIYRTMKQMKVDFNNLKEVEKTARDCFWQLKDFISCFHADSFLKYEDLGSAQWKSARPCIQQGTLFTRDARIKYKISEKLLRFMQKLDPQSRVEFFKKLSNQLRLFSSTDIIGGKLLNSRKNNSAKFFSSMARIFQRMALKKENVETAANSTVTAAAYLQAARMLATMSAGEAVATIGVGGVVALCIAAGTVVFTGVYLGTRGICRIEDSKTGRSVDMDMTDYMENWFLERVYKTQDVLAKKPPAEMERLQKRARKHLDKFLDEIGVSATKSVIYAIPPKKAK